MRSKPLASLRGQQNTVNMTSVNKVGALKAATSRSYTEMMEAAVVAAIHVSSKQRVVVVVVVVGGERGGAGLVDCCIYFLGF